MEQKTDITAAKFLGKKVQGSEFYDPSLPVAIPRCENRKAYNIDNNALPFKGADVWHAYEFSALTEKGLPVTRLLKLKYDCSSQFIVESKSLKLYLNSFNMSKFGETPEKCIEICAELIKKDLSEKLKTEVSLTFLDNNTKRYSIFENFQNILELTNIETLEINEFKEAPHLLCAEQKEKAEEHYLKFDSLRSNCRVTHQPDFGDIYIYYKSAKHISESSLVKYLCSFRSEYHFHEECCEMIFKRLYDLLNTPQDELFVCALYTRRGGIDICPLRKTVNCRLNDEILLADITKLARSGNKQ